MLKKLFLLFVLFIIPANGMEKLPIPGKVTIPLWNNQTICHENHQKEARCQRCNARYLLREIELFAQHNDLERIRELINLDADIHATIVGKTALRIACVYGHIEVVKLLLPHATHDEIDDVLYHIIQIFSIPNHEKVLELLLKTNRFNINKIHANQSSGLTLLGYATTQGKEKIVKMLLDVATIDINLCGAVQTSPFGMAVHAGREALVKMFLQKAALDINLFSKEKRTTPLIVAARNVASSKNRANDFALSSITILRELIKHGCLLESVIIPITPSFDINSIVHSVFADSPLLYAVIQGNLQDLETNLPNAHPSALKEALLYAIGQGQESIASVLIMILMPQNRAFLSNECMSHLDLLLSQKNTETRLQAYRNIKKLLTLKLTPENPSSIQQKNKPSLHSIQGQPYTIYSGGIPNPPPNSELARKHAQSPQSIPQPNITNPRISPVRPAPISPLLKKPSAKSRNLHATSQLKELPVQPPVGSHSIPLIEAVEKDDREKVKELLRNGANVNVQDARGETSLHKASRSGNFSIAELLCSVPTIDLNIPETESSATPLHFAVFYNHKSITDLLLHSPKTRVNVRDKNQITPLGIALQQKYDDLIPLLLYHGEHVRVDKNHGEALERIFHYYPLLKATAFGEVHTIENGAKNSNEMILESAMQLAIGQKQLSVIEKLLTAAQSFVGKEFLYEQFIKHAELLADRFKDSPESRVYQRILTIICDNLIFDSETDKIPMQHKNTPEESVTSMARPSSNQKKSGKLCAICIEDLDEAPVTALHCAHVFHKTCINQYDFAKNGCPVCRMLVQSEQEFPVAIRSSAVVRHSSNPPAVPHVQANQLFLDGARDGNRVLIGGALTDGADINVQDSEGRTALHFATIQNNEDIVRFLLTRGARADIPDRRNQKCLHKACACGSLPLIALLRQFNANIDERAGAKNRTPLHYAILQHQDQAACYLLEQGADVNACDDDNKSPLSYALEQMIPPPFCIF